MHFLSCNCRVDLNTELSDYLTNGSANMSWIHRLTLWLFIRVKCASLVEPCLRFDDRRSSSAWDYYQTLIFLICLCHIYVKVNTAYMELN